MLESRQTVRLGARAAGHRGVYPTRAEIEALGNALDFVAEHWPDESTLENPAASLHQLLEKMRETPATS